MEITDRAPPTAEEYASWRTHYSNWVRWRDELGTLNFVTPEELAVACAGAHRWEFQFVVAPLVIPRRTGSPVYPLAIR